MPMRRADYPPDWAAISRAARDRAGNRCAWCGVANGAMGARDRHGQWRDEDAIHGLNSDYGYELFGEFPRMIRIVLTTAHLGVPYPDGRPGDKHDKMDCRPENLAALCQACHLGYDRADHLQAAAATRERKRRARQPLLPGLAAL